MFLLQENSSNTICILQCPLNTIILCTFTILLYLSHFRTSLKLVPLSYILVPHSYSYLTPSYLYLSHTLTSLILLTLSYSYLSHTRTSLMLVLLSYSYLTHTCFSLILVPPSYLYLSYTHQFLTRTFLIHRTYNLFKKKTFHTSDDYIIYTIN